MNMNLHPDPAIDSDARIRTHRPWIFRVNGYYQWTMSSPARNPHALTEAHKRRLRSMDISQLELSTVDFSASRSLQWPDLLFPSRRLVTDQERYQLNCQR